MRDECQQIAARREACKRGKAAFTVAQTMRKGIYASRPVRERQKEARCIQRKRHELYYDGFITKFGLRRRIISSVESHVELLKELQSSAQGFRCQPITARNARHSANLEPCSR